MKIDGRTAVRKKQGVSFFQKAFRQGCISGKTEDTHRNTPGFPDSCFAAGQGKGREPPKSFSNCIVGADSCRMDMKQFSSPDCPVKPESCPIKRESQSRILVSMLGEDTVNMGKMMLKTKNRKTRLKSICRGKIVRVAVTDCCYGRYFKQSGKVLHHFPKKSIGFRILEITNMLADKGKFGNFAYYCWGIGAAAVVASLIFR